MAMNIGSMSKSGFVKVEIDVKTALSDIEKAYGHDSKAVQYTVRDMKSRGPGIVADEVRKVYMVQKKDIMPKAGINIQTSGDSLTSFTLTYKGKHLVPSKSMFHLTPAARPGANPYALRMTVKRGRREVIGRYRKTRTRGGPYSQKTGALLMGDQPRQRMEPGHKGKLRTFTTTSIPQMVSNTEDGVRDRIETKLAEEANKRLEYHLSRDI